MLKVMSFNIRYGLAEDGPQHWEQRKPLVKGRLEAFDPDLLGLQECRDDAQAAFMRQTLPAHTFHAVRREGGGDPALEMAPAVWRTAAFEVLRQGCFWLSATPAVAGSKSWDSVFARTATWVELRERASGRALVFLNTHFDYQPQAIDAAAQLLARWVDETLAARPVIVTGDFNADKTLAAYLRLTASGRLVDAHRAGRAGGADEPTFHGFGQPGALTAIDWLLVSEHFEVAAAAVDTYQAAGLYPSDHYPLTAVLTWKAA